MTNGDYLVQCGCHFVKNLYNSKVLKHSEFERISNLSPNCICKVINGLTLKMGLMAWSSRWK